MEKNSKISQFFAFLLFRYRWKRFQASMREIERQHLMLNRAA